MLYDVTAEPAGPVRSGARPWHVVAVLLATGLAAVVPTAATSSAALPASVVLLVVLSTLAVRSSSVAVRQSVLLVDLLFVAVAVGVLGLWPVPAAIAVVLAWWLSGRGVDEHRWSAWCRRGRTRDLPWLVAGTVVVTAGALLAWQRLFDGKLPREYVDAAAGQPWWAIVLAGVAFSLLNAAVEEIVFRGVLLSALTDVLGVRVAVVLQAVAFGVLHLHGVPSGPVGMVMAGAWGLLLGVMRVRSRGLLAPYVTHIAADATIVLLMLPALTA